MEIIVSGRHHLSTSTKLKDYVRGKLNDVLDVKSLKITSARVILDHEKDRYNAEVIVYMKKFHIEASAETEDLYASIDGAIARVERQVKKHIEKLQNHHHKGLDEIVLPIIDKELEEELDAIERLVGEID
jgi:putative sigma-54 modulation protein